MEKYIINKYIYNKNAKKLQKKKKKKKKSYKLKIIVSAKFMASSLSNLNDNPAEGTHKIEKDFETKVLSEYHDWYVQSDKNMCLKIYRINATCFSSASRLSWQEFPRLTKKSDGRKLAPSYYLIFENYTIWSLISK